MDSRAWGACILCLLSPLPVVSSPHRPSRLACWAPEPGAAELYGGPAGAWWGPRCSSPAQEFLPTKQVTGHGSENPCPLPSASPFLFPPSSLPPLPFPLQLLGSG